MKKEWKKPLALAIVIALIFFIVVSYALSHLSIYTEIHPLSCVGQAYFACMHATINTKGQISFELINQGTKKTIYNVALSCAIGNSLVPACSMEGQCAYNSSFIPKNYTFNSTLLGNGDMLVGGNLVAIDNLSCYNTNGSRLGFQWHGKRFDGNIYVWLRYTNPNGTNYTIVPGALQLDVSVT